MDFQIGNDPDEMPVGIAIRNAGPGPADIRSVVFYVDRKSVTDAEEAGNTYGKLSDSELDYDQFDPDDTLAVGETAWLIQYRKPRGGKINQKNLEKFADLSIRTSQLRLSFVRLWKKASVGRNALQRGAAGEGRRMIPETTFGAAHLLIRQHAPARYPKRHGLPAGCSPRRQ